MENRLAEKIDRELDRLARETQVEFWEVLNRVMQRGKLKGLPEWCLRELSYSAVASTFYNFLAKIFFSLRIQENMPPLDYTHIYFTVRDRMEKTRDTLLLELAGSNVAPRGSEYDLTLLDDENVPEA